MMCTQLRCRNMCLRAGGRKKWMDGGREEEKEGREKEGRESGDAW